jgi:hypothetical protein
VTSDFPGEFSAEGDSYQGIALAMPKVLRFERAFRRRQPNAKELDYCGATG